MPRGVNIGDALEKYAEDPDDEYNKNAAKDAAAAMNDDLSRDPLTAVRTYMEHQQNLEREMWERGEIDPQEYEQRKKSWAGMENMYRREMRKKMGKSKEKKYVGGRDTRLPPTNPDPGPEIEYKEHPAEKAEPPKATERPSVNRGDDRYRGMSEVPRGHAMVERMVVPLNPTVMKGLMSGAPMSPEVLEAIKSLRGKYDFNPYE